MVSLQFWKAANNSGQLPASGNELDLEATKVCQDLWVEILCRTDSHTVCRFSRVCRQAKNLVEVNIKRLPCPWMGIRMPKDGPATKDGVLGIYEDDQSRRKGRTSKQLQLSEMKYIRHFYIMCSEKEYYGYKLEYLHQLIMNTNAKTFDCCFSSKNCGFVADSVTRELLSSQLKALEDIRRVFRCIGLQDENGIKNAIRAYYLNLPYVELRAEIPTTVPDVFAFMNFAFYYKDFSCLVDFHLNLAAMEVSVDTCHRRFQAEAQKRGLFELYKSHGIVVTPGSNEYCFWLYFFNQNFMFLRIVLRPYV